MGKPPFGVLCVTRAGFVLKIMGDSMEICRSMWYSKL